MRPSRTHLPAVPYTLLHTLAELAALPVHVVVFLLRRRRVKAAILHALCETAKLRRARDAAPHGDPRG